MRFDVDRTFGWDILDDRCTGCGRDGGVGRSERVEALKIGRDRVQKGRRLS
jgi:hypothetical protein